ncbi:DUF4041 domain-containing protein [Polyangium mundeleinium]|uniref:DUF4041 domain-containing protein n=1 Tax=Polyangium mundeleinium TaxID=2995306 RepID=A0ABT5FA65_9BACT|nr:DUF4041 domain-containing protein [Polyangium mundeleinium]MDC0750011.1 DUF4041 domain-containing protein [Polyangium mundeleinium]
MEILLVVLLLGALAAVAFFASKAKKADDALRQANQAKAGLDKQIASLQKHVKRLSRYETVIEAEEAAASIRAKAETWAVEARAQAEVAATQMKTEARREADRLVAEAKTTNAQARASAQAAASQASADAARTIAEANRRAEEIAAGALEAMRDSKRLEQTVQAMKNVIEGYGDRYVMPTAGLLDDLAEEFGFAEAGQRLKAAREKVRNMIKQGTAATCDYVEANRRTTAIEFVLDAFNGKTDAILADVRHDNHGTLQQKIRDVFTLVNHNGRAFRDARILPEYLEARLEELRWAVVAQELKLKEREEQRLIKERIREEERAQREFEKALKEAEKEQETIRKAMDKARRDVDKASAEERAKYEEKLRELSEKLRLAEEKNKRALSMAQQTKSGYVYVISNIGSFGENVYKIGMTRRLEPLDRVRELGDASVPFEFDVHALIPSEDAPALEHALHERFVRSQVNKVNPRKEFFRVALHDIRQELEQMKVDGTWTIAAEAREFRETQAIERAMAEKRFDEKAWLEMQAKAEAASVGERELVEATA